jgi:hypothetical protein
MYHVVIHSRAMDPQGPDSGDRSRQRRERKERVLHTRISDDLADDIRRVAEDLRVPVSNLVRNVLEEAFSVVETVTDNVGGLIEDVVEEAERARERMRQRRSRSDPPEAAEAPAPEEAAQDVLGWQPLILNRSQRCSECERLQEGGERAYVGVWETGPSTHFLCPDCADARRR